MTGGVHDAGLLASTLNGRFLAESIRSRITGAN